MCLRPPIIDLDVLAFDKARRAQALAESTQTDRIRIRADGREKPDYRHRRLLRVCRKRPRGCRAAEQRDELAALQLHDHSITSSARASSVGGTSAQGSSGTIFKSRWKPGTSHHCARCDE